METEKNELRDRLQSWPEQQLKDQGFVIYGVVARYASYADMPAYSQTRVHICANLHTHTHTRARARARAQTYTFMKL